MGCGGVTEVMEVAGLEEDVISLGTLFTYRFTGENPDGSLKGVFEPTGMRPRFLPRLEYYGLATAFLDALKPDMADASQ